MFIYNLIIHGWYNFLDTHLKCSMFFRDLVSKNNNFSLKRVKITTEEFLTSKANALTKVFFFFFFLNIYSLLFVSTSKLEIWTHWRAKVSSGRRWGHMVSASDDLLKELQWFVGHPSILITNQPYLLHLRDIKTNRQLMFYANNDKHVSKRYLREP